MLSFVGPVGPLLMVTVGAVRSITIARLAAAPWLPAASVARMSTVWLPSVKAAVVYGDVQAANAPASERH